MKVNNLTKIISGVVVVVVLIGIFFIAKFGGQNPLLQNQKPFVAKDYAASNGYRNYFEYQNELYLNVDGNWKKVKDYAAEKGYTDYFTSHGNWFIKVNGKWETVKEYADAKGYKDSFLFRGIKFQNTNGTWLRVATK